MENRRVDEIRHQEAVKYGAALISAAVNWWLRSANSEAQFRYVNTNGNANSNNASNTGNWMRPDLAETSRKPVKGGLPLIQNINAETTREQAIHDI